MLLCQTAVCCPYVCNPHEIFAKNCNNFHGVNSIKLCISRVHRQKEKDFKFFLEVLFGAGYGNRTRLLGLGSRCTTDVLTLRSEAIIAENFVQCNRKMLEKTLEAMRSCEETVAEEMAKL